MRGRLPWPIPGIRLTGGYAQLVQMSKEPVPAESWSLRVTLRLLAKSQVIFWLARKPSRVYLPRNGAHRIMPTSVETPIDFVALSQQYSGRWVAIDPATGRVVASGESAVDVYSEATKSGIQEPLVTRVAESYGDYVTCLS